MTNVIDLFPEPAEDNPIAFLNAMEQSLIQGHSLTRFAPHVGGFLASVQQEDWFRVFARASRILARIDWRPLSEKEQPSVQRVEISDDLHLQAKKVVDTIMAAYEAEEELHAKAAKRGLKHFPPAYAYLDAFDGFFGTESPVDYIEYALGILSPDEPYAHPDDCWFADDDRRALDSTQLEFFVKDLLVPLIALNATADKLGQELSDADKQRHVGRMLLMVPAIGLPQLFTGRLSDFELPKFEFPNLDAKPVDSSLAQLLQQIDSAAGFVALMLRPGIFPLPQGLLVALVRRFLDDAYEVGEELGARIGFHLLNWPLGIPQESWEEVETSLVAPEWGSELRALYTDPSNVPFLPCRMLSQWLYPLYDNVAALCFGLEDDRAGLYGRMLGKYSDKLDALAVKLNGHFPWPAGSPGNWYYRGGSEPSDSWSLQLLLQAADAEASIYEVRDPIDDPYDKESPFHIYSCLWASANRRGFPKLGNAVLSFYLFRKLIACVDSSSPPRYVAGPLRTQLNLSLATPGHTWVIRALEISRQVCKQKGWGIDWLVLDSLANGESETAISPEALTKSPDSIIELGFQREKKLLEEVGPPWLRLSDRFRRMICHAEAQFERDAPYLGTNEREYKGQIIDFVVPFEIELGDRLETLYLSQEMQEYFLQNWRGYKKPSKPCLWDFLHLLKEFLRMPANLQVLVRQRVGAVAESEDVLKQLDKLRERSRNKAGHRDLSPPQDLVMTRELIFAKGLLKDFAAALPDRNTD